MLSGVLVVAIPAAAQAIDPGINQPGALGNPRADPGRNQPGAIGNVGVGAPGAGVRDPGINQPGAMGNVGAPGVGVGAPGVAASWIRASTNPAPSAMPALRAGRYVAEWLVQHTRCRARAARTLQGRLTA